MRGRICGTGSYIPEHYYDNNDLAKFVETNDEWIRERTGIVRRHIASSHRICRGHTLCQTRCCGGWDDSANPM